MRNHFGCFLVICLLIVAVAGCGSSGDSTQASESGKKAAETAAKEKLDPSLRGPARQFLAPGVEIIVNFGHEASKAERAQASRVIQAWMRARAARDFPRECRYFSKTYKKEFVAEDAKIISRGKVNTCPKALAYFGAAASGNFKNNLAGPIDSLRVGEAHGYALYHGSDGRNWDLFVDRENGKWLVALATPKFMEKPSGR